MNELNSNHRATKRGLESTAADLAPQPRIPWKETNAKLTAFLLSRGDVGRLKRRRPMLG